MKKVVFLITFLLCGVFAYAQTSTENIGGLLYSIDTEAKTATLIYIPLMIWAEQIILLRKSAT